MASGRKFLTTVTRVKGTFYGRKSSFQILLKSQVASRLLKLQSELLAIQMFQKVSAVRCPLDLDTFCMI
jgi:hypothetical protein